MGVYQLVTLQPGFLHVHLFDRLGVKPEHLLPLEIPCNDAQAIGAGFLKSLQNKGSSVSQPIWKWFTGSVIWSKNTFLKLNSNWAFDFMNEPWIYCLVLCTLDSFLFSDSDIRTKNVTSYRQCSLYFESATVRQTIAIQLWRDFLCHRTHLFPVINLRYKAPPTSSLSVFHFFSFPFFGRNFWKMEFPNFTSAFFLFQEFWWFRPFAFIHQLFIILLLFSKEELFHSFPSLFLKPVILLNSRFSFEKVEW